MYLGNIRWWFTYSQLPAKLLKILKHRPLVEHYPVMKRLCTAEVFSIKINQITSNTWLIVQQITKIIQCKIKIHRKKYLILPFFYNFLLIMCWYLFALYGLLIFLKIFMFFQRCLFLSIFHLIKFYFNLEKRKISIST